MERLCGFRLISQSGEDMRRVRSDRRGPYICANCPAYQIILIYALNLLTFPHSKSR